MGSSVTIEYDVPEMTGTSQTKTFDIATRDNVSNEVCRQVKGVLSKMYNGGFSIWTSDGDVTKATATIAPTQTGIVAGDILWVGNVPFVATNSAVVVGAATFDMRTSDTAVGASIAVQVTGYVALKGVIASATASAGTVTLTATLGAVANQIQLSYERSATVATLALTFVFASGATGDTVQIGDVTLTAVASSPTPASDEWDYDTDDDDTATTFAAAVNAGSLAAFGVSAVAASAVVTVTGPAAILSNLVYVAKANAKVASTGGITVSQSDGTVGDTLDIGEHTYTAVVPTADPTAGEFEYDTDDDTAAASLAAAINQLTASADIFSGASASAVATVTCLVAGEIGDNIDMVKTVTTGAALTLDAAHLTGGTGKGSPGGVTFSGDSLTGGAGGDYTTSPMTFNGVAAFFDTLGSGVGGIGGVAPKTFI